MERREDGRRTPREGAETDLEAGGFKRGLELSGLVSEEDWSRVNDWFAIDDDGAYECHATGKPGTIPLVLAALDGRAAMLEDVREAVLAELACFPPDTAPMVDRIMARLTAKKDAPTDKLAALEKVRHVVNALDWLVCLWHRSGISVAGEEDERQADDEWDMAWEEAEAALSQIKSNAPRVSD